MSISPGYTNEEIREFVYQYEDQPWGTRQDWLNSQGVSNKRFRRWRDAIYDGDLGRGLIPRQSSPMTSPSQRRFMAMQNKDQEAENERLRKRVRELEQANETLGKAIGLLHQLNEQEPGTSQTNEADNS